MAKRHSGRKLRNFLLNKKLQLSFALFMLGVTALLCIALISVTVYIMNKSSEMFSRQRRETTKMFVKQRRDSTKMFTRQRREATKIMQKQLKVATEMLNVMKLDDSLKTAVEQAQKDIRNRDAERVKTRKLQDEELAKRRAKEDQELKKRREKADQEMAAKRRLSTIILIIAMVGGCLLFLAVLFFYGIILTHKVAGPLFKLTRHMDEVKDGQLKRIWGLRKGDQLVEFFGHFQNMHQALKKRRIQDIETLELAQNALDGVEGKKADEARSSIESLLKEKEETLERDEEKS